MSIHREVRRSTAGRSRFRTSARWRSTIAANAIRPQNDPVRVLAAALERFAGAQGFDAGVSLPGTPKPVVGADARANLRLAGILSLIAIAAALLTPGLGPPGDDDSSFVFSDDVWSARHTASAVRAGGSEAVVTESISLGPNARD